MANRDGREELGKLAIEPTVTLFSTFPTFDASSRLIPVAGEVKFRPDRGSGLVATEQVMDGLSGPISRTRVSTGYSASLPHEIHDIDGDNAAPYWVLMMMACGFFADIDTVAKTVTFTPDPISMAVFVDPFIVDQNPTTVAFKNIKSDAGDGTTRADTARDVANATGSMDFRFADGEFVIHTMNVVGLVETEFLNDGTTDLSGVGAFESGVDSPEPSVNLTCVFTEIGVGALAFASVSEISVQSNADLTGQPNMNDANGMGITPPRFLVGSPATLDLVIADTDGIDAKVWDSFFDGNSHLEVVVTVTMAGGRSIVYTFERCQYVDVQETGRNGYRALQISTELRREKLGDTTDLMKVVYTYGTP